MFIYLIVIHCFVGILVALVIVLICPDEGKNPLCANGSNVLAFSKTVSHFLHTVIVVAIK